MRPALLLYAALAVGLLAGSAEWGRTASARSAETAQAALARNRFGLVPGEIAGSLPPVFARYNQRFEYSNAVALKRLGRWGELAETAESLVRWHPDGAGIHLLAAEAHWQAGDHAAAETALWEALWRRPYPKRSAAQFWALAMDLAAERGGPGDPRAIAAAIRVAQLAPGDPDLTEPARADLHARAATLLEAAGAPMTAESVRK